MDKVAVRVVCPPFSEISLLEFEKVTRGTSSSLTNRSKDIFSPKLTFESEFPSLSLSGSNAKSILIVSIGSSKLSFIPLRLIETLVAPAAIVATELDN